MDISLISEGITDRPIIEATLAAYFAKNNLGSEVFLNPLHPEDKEPCGWFKVLKFC